LRGGGWNNNRDNARCAYRNNNHPNNRNNNIGFRLVCASHIFPHLLGRRWTAYPPLTCCERYGRQRLRQRFRQWPPTKFHGFIKRLPLRRLRKKAKVKARESRGARRTKVRRSDSEMKRNAEIGFFTKPSRFACPRRRLNGAGESRPHG